MNNLSIVEYQNKRVLTTEQLAKVYGTDKHNIVVNYQNHKPRFEVDKDYYLLEGDELRTFKRDINNIDLVKKNLNKLFLWTERGANRHCKMLATDQAWKQFDILEETYFMVRSQQIKPELHIPQTMAEALQLAADLAKTVEQQEIQLLIQSPKAKFYDEMFKCSDVVSLEAVAKLLEREGYGRNNLMKLLREQGILNQRNLPYQQYINNGYFRSTMTWKDTDKIRFTICTMVHVKGLEFIVNLFDRLGIKRSEK